MSPTLATRPSRVATVVLVALSLLLGSLLAAASTAARPTPAAAATGVCDTNEYSCWMGRFAPQIGQRPLNQVVQPGSHDTGTYDIKNDGSLARNQDATVYQSLARGIRQFDIRAHPRTLNGQTDLYAYHGTVDTDVKLSTMLDDVQRYTTSPGTGKEIIYLHVNTDRDQGGQLLVDTCKRVRDSMGALALTPSMAYAAPGQMKSMDEIWALPGSPRVIFDWPGCQGNGAFWSQDWSANGDYYADQGNTPCVKYAVTKALEGRWSGTDSTDPNRGTDIPYSYQQGNPCWNFGNVPAGSQPMTKLDKQVNGLYILYIQQTGLVPSSALYVQRDVMSMLVDYWDRNVGSARANLNYVSADFVLDSGTSLITKTVGLNTRSAQPLVNTTFDASDSDPARWRYSYGCSTNGETASGAKITAWNATETAQSTDAVRVSDTRVTLPLKSTAVVRCTDGAGRRARLVQANTLAAVSAATQSVTADLDQLPAPTTVRLTDAYGKPLAGHYVNLSVSGPARLTTDGRSTSGGYTDADGKVTAPVYLTHGVGTVTVTATTPLAAQTVTTTATVAASAPAAISATAGDQQSTGQDKPFTNPLVVTVKDKNSNPVAGQRVVFKVESGPATLGGQPTATVTTGADGTASTTVQAGGTDGDVVVSATTGSLRTTFGLQVVFIVQGPGPTPAPDPVSDTSVEVKGPKSIKLGATGTIKVSVVNAGPDAAATWYSLVTVGSGLKITGTSLGAASGTTVQVSGDGVAADGAVDFTVTVRALHRGQVGYAVLAGSDNTDPDDQNDSEVRVLKVR